MKFASPLLLLLLVPIAARLVGPGTPLLLPSAMVGILLVLAQARSFGLEGAMLHDFGMAALLHDTGKLQIPVEITGVPAEVMKPRETWADTAAYDTQAKKLAGMFAKNIEKFGDAVSDAVRKAGPKA